MKKIIVLFGIVLFFHTCAYSQQIVKGEPVSIDQRKAEDLNKLLRKYKVFSIDVNEMYHSLSDSSKRSEIILVLGTERLQLTLMPNELRSKDYQVSLNGKEIIKPVLPLNL